jgi:hypothetical protein
MSGFAPSSEAIYRFPDPATMQHAAKIAIEQDKPIMMDYWMGSIDKSVSIGFRGSDKILVRNEQEYTSPIANINRVGDKEYVIATENSIYIVDAKIPLKKLA